MNCEEQYNEIKKLLNSNLTFTSCEVKEIQESAISLCNDYLKNNILSLLFTDHLMLMIILI